MMGAHKTKQKGYELSEIAAIREMLARNIPYSQIGASIPGRTCSSVRGMIRRIKRGLATDGIQTTDARRALIAELWPTRMDHVEVMRRLNELPGPTITCRRVVAQAAQKMGLKRPQNYAGRPTFKRTTWSDERIALLRECRAKGMVGRQIMPLVNALPGPQIKSPERITEAAKKYRIAFVAAPKPPKPPKPPREPKPRKVSAPKPKRPMERIEPIARAEPIEVPPRIAGWREISDWYFAATGKREWMPDMRIVNALRVRMGLARFSPVGGVFTRLRAA